jgi:hypothetical protein
MKDLTQEQLEDVLVATFGAEEGTDINAQWLAARAELTRRGYMEAKAIIAMQERTS